LTKFSGFFFCEAKSEFLDMPMAVQIFQKSCKPPQNFRRQESDEASSIMMTHKHLGAAVKNLMVRRSDAPDLFTPDYSNYLDEYQGRKF
jgi:hypothetical protein